MTREQQPASTVNSVTVISLIHMQSSCTQKADDTDRITRYTFLYA